MSGSFQNPVGGNKPSDPYDYRVEEIQKDKSDQSAPPPPPKKPVIAALIIHAFKKFLELFENERKDEKFIHPEELKAHLLEIRALFESLQIEDRSEDESFFRHLSQYWLLLHDDLLLFSHRSPLTTDLHVFIQSIQDYPEGSEHTLGYYLSENSGQAWMPFPYMELIRALWADYQQNGDESCLAKWCRNLSEIIEILETGENHTT